MGEIPTEFAATDLRDRGLCTESSGFLRSNTTDRHHWQPELLNSFSIIDAFLLILRGVEKVAVEGLEDKVDTVYISLIQTTCANIQGGKKRGEITDCTAHIITSIKNAIQINNLVIITVTAQLMSIHPFVSPSPTLPFH